MQMLPVEISKICHKNIIMYTDLERNIKEGADDLSRLSVVVAQIWIYVCSYLVLSGWGLSLAGHLSLTGYAVVLIPPLVYAVLVIRKKYQSVACWEYRKIRGLFNASLPMAFLVLSVLVLLGGLIYPPCNYDAMSYRIPRVLNWLAEGSWHWIDGHNARMNISPSASEWVLSPWLAFFGNDRYFFLVQYMQFLMLPGLTFALFTQLGVSRKMAFIWMWIFPSAYGVVLQAASLGNDIYGIVFFMIALLFAITGGREKRASHLVISLLAIALMTNAKASNLPLVLPWFIAAVGSWKLAWQYRFRIASAVVVAAFISFLPHMIINYTCCGDWSGASLMEGVRQVSNPLAGFVGNSIWLLVQNTGLPMLPMASRIDGLLLQLIPDSVRTWLAPNFEAGFSSLGFAELQIEEIAGLGAGMLLVVLACLIFGVGRKRSVSDSSDALEKPAVWVFYAGLVTVLVFMAKSGVSTGARIFMPYTVLVIAFFALVGQASRRKGFRIIHIFGLLSIISSCFVVILTPARPLWPALSVLHALDPVCNHAAINRAERVYAVYRKRPSVLMPVSNELDPDANVVGLIGAGDDLEAQLWKPYGSRRIIHISTDTDGEQLAFHGITKIVVRKLAVQIGRVEHFEQWLDQIQPVSSASFSLRLRASGKPEEWVILSVEDSVLGEHSDQFIGEGE